MSTQSSHCEKIDGISNFFLPPKPCHTRDWAWDFLFHTDVPIIPLIYWVRFSVWNVQQPDYEYNINIFFFYFFLGFWCDNNQSYSSISLLFL